ncbi:MAG: hypothetical protein M0011_08905 [Elusimicrobia bacterium]|nr:hypothetical protein [Elusimicrobiota bacterium]
MSLSRLAAVLSAMLVLGAASAADSRAGWTPFKVQTSPGGWDWPEDADTVAGLVFNFKGDTSRIYGLQLGWINGSDSAAGIQLSLAYNLAADGVYGLQASPAVNFADRQYGLQLGAWNSANRSMGLQAAWLRNWSDRGGGLMAAPVNVTKSAMRGIQAGVVNRSDGDMSGIQLGLLNICRGTLKGLQLGFANIGGQNALLPFAIGFNAGF